VETSGHIALAVRHKAKTDKEKDAVTIGPYEITIMMHLSLTFELCK